jgi:hypothetical protein
MGKYHENACAGRVWKANKRKMRVHNFFFKKKKKKKKRGADGGYVSVSDSSGKESEFIHLFPEGERCRRRERGGDEGREG